MSANLGDVDVAMENKGEVTEVVPCTQHVQPAASAVAATPASAVAATPAPSVKKQKKRKEMEPRSSAWQQFDKCKNKAGESKAVCKFCNLELACDTKKNGTKGMLEHMKKCFQLPHSADPNQSEMSTYLKPDGSKSVGGTWRFDQEDSKRALAKMIIEDELPFRLVEGAGFRKFMAVVQNRFQVPSRSTISRFCYKMYVEEKLRLKEFLMSNCERVCITTDTWTSIQRINYMVLTAHFIDSDWNLQKKVLNFIPITSHKGEAIGKAIEKCLVDWGISKVFTITVDNASSNDLAVGWIKKRMNQWGTSICNEDFIHVRCIAHIVNLMVLHGLSTVGTSIIKIREAVRYIRQSPSRLSKFKDCVEREQIESKALLCLDVCTRWNSTYLMLETALKFEKVFEAYEDVDPFYRMELDMREERRKKVGKKRSNEEEVGGDLMDVWTPQNENSVADGVEYVTGSATVDCGGVPKEGDWENARRLCSTLKYFYNLTRFVSGSKYVTSNAYFDQISNVASMLRTWEMSSDIELRVLARKMHEKYDKYWGNVTKFNSLLYVAAVFDPRKKMDYVVFALLDVHGEILGTELAEKVKRDTERMYVAYWEMYKKGNENFTAVLEKGGCCGSDSVCEGSTDMDAELTNAREERYRKFKEASGGASIQIKSELESYLQESVIVGSKSFSILDWWKKHTPRFPILSKMARDVLAVPVSTVASESAFSTDGRVLDPFRSSLTPMVVQALICAQDWFRTSKEPMKVEEDLADLEKMENEFSQMAVETTVVET